MTNRITDSIVYSSLKDTHDELKGMLFMSIKQLQAANQFKITSENMAQIHELCRVFNARDKGVDPRSDEARKGSRSYWRLAFILIRNEHLYALRKQRFLDEIAKKARLELQTERMERQKALSNKKKRVKLTLKRNNPVTTAC